MEYVNYTGLYISYLENPDSLDRDGQADSYIDPENIGPMLFTLSGLLTKWGFVLTIAEENYEDVRSEVDVVLWNKLWQKYTDILTSSGTKITDKKLDQLCAADPEYQQKKIMLNKTKMIVSKIKHQLIALDTKCKMLQSINSRNKAEFHSIPNKM